MSQGFTRELNLPLAVSQGGTGVSASNPVLQRVVATNSAGQTGTTQIPTDNTIPQITEGDEYITCTITPLSATSKLEIVFNGYGSHSAITTPTVALFKDTIVNALTAESVAAIPTGNYIAHFYLRHTMTSGTTSSITFRIRIGGNSAGTTYVNRGNVGQYYGGSEQITLSVTEYSS